MIKKTKKLIEVALPLDDINAAAAREKSIRHGHPSTLHLWWARRPLAAARAVLFAQLVNDPGGERGWYAGKTKKEADQEREELFDIIRDLVKWENTNNEAVLARAREAIWKSWRETCEMNKGEEGFDPEKLPAFHDPFAGGGAIPLEAQRLGLESHASDLNPVAVMINKAMIEIPPKFAGRPPVGPVPDDERQTSIPTEWTGAQGLAEDVRRYGHWMREEAFKRIGHLYPKVAITAEMAKERPDLKGLVGEDLTVIAWIWARTVKSPNPAFSHVDVPLAATFILSSKKGKEAYVEPVIEDGGYRFVVKLGKPHDMDAAKAGTKMARGAKFRCIMSGVPMSGDHIKREGKAGRIGARLMAIVAVGDRKRIYLTPTHAHESVAIQAKPDWVPEGTFVEDARAFTPCIYGFTQWKNLFTDRQLLAMEMLSNLVEEARELARCDAIAAGLQDDERPLRDGGTGATAYAEALGTYLMFALGKQADLGNSFCAWEPIAQCPRHLFGRQAIPMVWDYAEANPLGDSSGAWIVFLNGIVKAFSKGFEKTAHTSKGYVQQADAGTQGISENKIVSTDPPYYDNVPYADLSDFFYVWMRRSLRSTYPDLFSTLAVPKSEELVAFGYRHPDGKLGAETFFLNGMTQAMHRLAELAHVAFPVSIYYAFKQADTKDIGTASTGWETFLEAVLRAEFSITGTWPLRTENSSRLRGQQSNALASSIVLVCQQRATDAPTCSRREFQRELRTAMPEALETMIGGTTGASPIAPVDLAQAAIGPGMGIFSRHSAVLNQDGTAMGVHDALILINKEITDYLNPESGNFDADTLFCDGWFDQYGWGEGAFGDADTLARAKGTSVAGVVEAGVAVATGGKVRLLKWAEYPRNWDPDRDERTPAWEATHQIIRALNQDGEGACGALLARLPEQAEAIRQLAYHLYTLCERKKWAEEARAYNELITSWHAIVTASQDAGHAGVQTELLGE